MRVVWHGVCLGRPFPFVAPATVTGNRLHGLFDACRMLQNERGLYPAYFIYFIYFLCLTCVRCVMCCRYTRGLYPVYFQIDKLPSEASFDKNGFVTMGPPLPPSTHTRTCPAVSMGRRYTAADFRSFPRRRAERRGAELAGVNTIRVWSFCRCDVTAPYVRWAFGLVLRVPAEAMAAHQRHGAYAAPTRLLPTGVALLKGAGPQCSLGSLRRWALPGLGSWLHTTHRHTCMRARTHIIAHARTHTRTQMHTHARAHTQTG